MLMRQSGQLLMSHFFYSYVFFTSPIEVQMKNKSLNLCAFLNSIIFAIENQTIIKQNQNYDKKKNSTFFISLVFVACFYTMQLQSP